MLRGNACSRVDWTRQVRRSRSATKARANSIASTGDSLASPQFAISRPGETAKSWRSLPLNAELLGCHGAACSRPSQTGLRALALVKSLEDDLDRISKVGPEKRPSRKPADDLREEDFWPGTTPG